MKKLLVVLLLLTTTNCIANNKDNLFSNDELNDLTSISADYYLNNIENNQEIIDRLNVYPVDYIITSGDKRILVDVIWYLDEKGRIKTRREEW